MAKFEKIAKMNRYANPALFALVTRLLPTIISNPTLLSNLRSVIPFLNTSNIPDMIDNVVKELTDFDSPLWDMFTALMVQNNITKTPAFQKEQFKPVEIDRILNEPGAAPFGMSVSNMPAQSEGGYGAEGASFLLSSKNEKFVKIAKTGNETDAELAKKVKDVMPSITLDQFYKQVNNILAGPGTKEQKEAKLSVYMNDVSRQIQKLSNFLVQEKFVSNLPGK